MVWIRAVDYSDNWVIGDVCLSRIQWLPRCCNEADRTENRILSMQLVEQLTDLEDDDED